MGRDEWIDFDLRQLYHTLPLLVCLLLLCCELAWSIVIDGNPSTGRNDRPTTGSFNELLMGVKGRCDGHIPQIINKFDRYVLLMC